MDCELFNASYTQSVIALFTSTFAASESEEEGRVIGRLVRTMIDTTDKGDLIGCVALEDDALIGGIFLSRFWVPNGKRSYLLSPVAVRSDRQRTGAGQTLIHFGLEHLRSLGASLVFTYGDPDYYRKTGFEKITEAVVQAPCRLSQPEGWLAQSLDGDAVEPMQGASRCIAALSDPTYW